MSDNNVSDDDKALFRRTVGTVRPLDKTKKLAVHPKKRPLVKTSKNPICHESSSTHYNLSNFYPIVVNSNSILSFCGEGMPRKRLTALRSGEIVSEARLDLHGLNPDSARTSLCDFIEKQTLQGKRCVLIIHGKGSKHGEAPVLKNHVNHWLQQLPQVLAFHSAIPRDGGTGALYVLLKRQRS